MSNGGARGTPVSACVRANNPISLLNPHTVERAPSPSPPFRTPPVVPSTRVVQLPSRGKFVYGLGTNIASTGSVVGAVTLGEFSSVWFNASLRGACVTGVPVACVAPPQFPPFPPTHPLARRL